MTMLLDERLRDLATQTHLLETKVSSLGWMAGAAARNTTAANGGSTSHRSESRRRRSRSNS